MDPLEQDLRELRLRLDDGRMQRAYRALLARMSRVRSAFVEERGERAIGALYQGFLDMTCFAVFPEALRARDLKLAVVFDYATFGLEVWLAARNRTTQRRTWEQLSHAGYEGHRLVAPAPGVDAIVVAPLPADLLAHDEDRLTVLVLDGVRAFESDVVSLLDRVDARRPERSPRRA